jgi:RNA 3'-terminal phosphate cyclase (ATP)
MCGGRLDGGAVRSSEISLTPGPLACGAYLADTGTAGSCTLMLQQALPCMVFAAPPAAGSGDGGGTAGAAGSAAAAAAVSPAPDLAPWGAGPGSPSGRWTHLDLRGGTDAAFAPPVGYLAHVLAPTLARLLPDAAADLSVRLVRRGFYPRGGGRVAARARALPPGGALAPFDVTRRGRVSARGRGEVQLVRAAAAAAPGKARLLDMPPNLSSPPWLAPPPTPRRPRS